MRPIVASFRQARDSVAQVDLRAPGVRIAVNGHFFLPFPADDRDAWVIGLGA